MIQWQVPAPIVHLWVAYNVDMNGSVGLQTFRRLVYALLAVRSRRIVKRHVPLGAPHVFNGADSAARAMMTGFAALYPYYGHYGHYGHGAESDIAQDG